MLTPAHALFSLQVSAILQGTNLAMPIGKAVTQATVDGAYLDVVAMVHHCLCPTPNNGVPSFQHRNKLVLQLHL